MFVCVCVCVCECVSEECFKPGKVKLNFQMLISLLVVFFRGVGGGGVKASNVFLPVRVCSIFSGAGNLSCPWTETAHTRHSK